MDIEKYHLDSGLLYYNVKMTVSSQQTHDGRRNDSQSCVETLNLQRKTRDHTVGYHVLIMYYFEVEIQQLSELYENVNGFDINSCLIIYYIF